MRILFLGDVVGRSGREAVIGALPMLRARLAADITIVNVENAAHGFGITAAMARDFLAAGADCLTTGNHVWDQRQILGEIDQEERLLRPLNFPDGTPGRGAALVGLADGRRVLVINVMGRLFMDALDDPFAAVDRCLASLAMPRDVDAVVVDMHAEATSEKMAMGHYLDGRVSLVVGTHTHVPTGDAMVLANGTAYLSDAGMCGDYDSVIGVRKEISVARFTTKLPGERMAPADGPATVCGLVVETDDASGLARAVAPLRHGGRLAPAWPDL